MLEMYQFHSGWWLTMLNRGQSAGLLAGKLTNHLPSYRFKMATSLPKHATHWGCSVAMTYPRLCLDSHVNLPPYTRWLQINRHDAGASIGGTIKMGHGASNQKQDAGTHRRSTYHFFCLKSALKVMKLDAGKQNVLSLATKLIMVIMVINHHYIATSVQ